MWHFISSIIFSRILQIWNVGTNNRATMATRLKKLLHTWLRWQQIFYSFYHLLKKNAKLWYIAEMADYFQETCVLLTRKKQAQEKRTIIPIFCFESKKISIYLVIFLCSYCRQQKSLLKYQNWKENASLPPVAPYSYSCYSLLEKAPENIKKTEKTIPLMRSLIFHVDIHVLFLYLVFHMSSTSCQRL